MRYAILFATAAVVGCADATAPTRHVVSSVPAGAASFDKGGNVHVSSHTRETLALNVLACSGEEVTGTDEETTQTNEEQNADGHVHFILHIHDTMKGVGSTTGAKYDGNAETHIDLNDTPKNSVSHFQFFLTLVGQGKVPDTHVRVDVDVHTDANGQATMSRQAATTTCK